MDYVTAKRVGYSDILTEEETAKRYITTQKVDTEKNILIGSDKTLSVIFECSPISGIDEDTLNKAIALASDNSYPDGMHAQYLGFRSPDIGAQLDQMKLLRSGFNSPHYNRQVDDSYDFFMAHSRKPLINKFKGHYNFGTIYDQKIFVTYKFPIKDVKPTDDELEAVYEWQTKLFTTLSGIGLAPRVLGANQYLRVLSTFVNWDSNANWISDNNPYNPDIDFSEQVFDFSTCIDHKAGYLKVGQKYVKVMSAKRRPDVMHFGDAMRFIGDLYGGQNNLKTNMAVCLNVYYEPADKAKTEIATKRQMVMAQSQGKFAVLAPEIKNKEADYNVITESINQGIRPVKTSFHVAVFSNSKKEVDQAATAVKSHFETARFSMMVDHFAQLPMFLNILPGNADVSAITELFRYKTIGADQATPMLPILGEWKGTSTPHLQLVSRNGQLMNLSLDDTDSNMNAVIAAQAGSGKSVLANKISTAYLSLGCRVWIIDQGRSYEKLCRDNDGQFIAFDAESKICLNPFETIISLDGSERTRDPSLKLTELQLKDDLGQEDLIVSILESMATDKGVLEDLQTAALRRILYEVWTQHYRATTIDMIAEKCLEDEEQLVKNIGKQLFSFTSKGSYGRFFNGKNNVQFDNQFIVLELEELKSRKQLQKVVLLQLISQIQSTIFLGDRSRSVVLMDEAWDLISMPSTAKFIEASYRLFRKYGASAIIVTQSLMDLYAAGAVGDAIIANTAFMFSLGQKDTTIESLKETKKYPMTEYEEKMLKSARTLRFVFSEIWLNTPHGKGIGRLLLTPYENLLFSTNAPDKQAIDKYRAKGLIVSDAVKAVLRDRGIAYSH